VISSRKPPSRFPQILFELQGLKQSRRQIIDVRKCDYGRHTSVEFALDVQDPTFDISSVSAAEKPPAGPSTTERGAGGWSQPSPAPPSATQSQSQPQSGSARVPPTLSKSSPSLFSQTLNALLQALVRLIFCPYRWWYKCLISLIVFVSVGG
jgi:hypothetical protein